MKIGEEVMVKLARISILMFFPLPLLSPVLSQAQNEQRRISGEGAVVAFMKNGRHPDNPSSKGTATFAEYWIVRIDKWAEGKNDGQKYLLVQFNLYERAASDSDINSDKLRFSLRERRADEHTDCLGGISVGGRRAAKLRQVRLSDYQRTKVGSADKIPPLKSLPCFIADEPPVVVEGGN